MFALIFVSLMAAFAVSVIVLMFLVINDVCKTVTNADTTAQGQL